MFAVRMQGDDMKFHSDLELAIALSLSMRGPPERPGGFNERASAVGSQIERNHKMQKDKVCYCGKKVSGALVIQAHGVSVCSKEHRFCEVCAQIVDTGLSDANHQVCSRDCLRKLKAFGHEN